MQPQPTPKKTSRRSKTGAAKGGLLDGLTGAEKAQLLDALQAIVEGDTPDED